MGADPNVIGKTLMLDGDRAVIVGVMPPGFRHPGRTLQNDVQMWGPAGFRASPFATESQPAVSSGIAGASAARRHGRTGADTAGRVRRQVSQQFAADYPPDNGWRSAA